MPRVSGEHILAVRLDPVCLQDRTEGLGEPGLPIDEGAVTVEREGVEPSIVERGLVPASCLRSVARGAPKHRISRVGGNRGGVEVVPRPMKTQWRHWPLLAVLSVVAVLIVACGTSSGAPSAPPGTGLSITAVAGPTCPVEKVPPDPACAPRPVAGATIVVLDAQGATVTTVVTDVAGAATAAVPPGDYVVQARPAAGLMGTPEAQTATVVAGAMTAVALDYDTGIR